MNEAHYILLLQKSLADEISPAEQQALDAWLDQSADNKRIAESVRKAWELSGNFAADVELDTERDYLAIERRIREEAPEKSVVPIRTGSNRHMILRIAAVFLLIAACYFIYDKFSEPIVEYEIVRTEQQPALQPIVLVDGTEVWLNSHTKFSHFVSTTGMERRVKVNGEAFFKVAHDDNKPFVVETRSGEVTVLGTSFNVKERTGDLEVFVASGRVELSPKKGRESLVLTQNEKGVYHAKEHRLERISAANPNDLSWQSNKLVFENTPLKEALEKINDHFKVNIVLSDSGLGECPLTATFRDKEIDAIVRTLEVMLGAQSEFTSPDKYLLKGGVCD